jgi:hypothetical protein
MSERDGIKKDSVPCSFEKKRGNCWESYALIFLPKNKKRVIKS